MNFCSFHFLSIYFVLFLFIWNLFSAVWLKILQTPCNSASPPWSDVVSGGWNGFRACQTFLLSSDVYFRFDGFTLWSLSLQAKSQLLFAFSNRAFRFRFSAVTRYWRKICQFYYFIFHLFFLRKNDELTETVWFVSLFTFLAGGILCYDLRTCVFRYEKKNEILVTEMPLDVVVVGGIWIGMRSAVMKEERSCVWPFVLTFLPVILLLTDENTLPCS